MSAKENGKKCHKVTFDVYIGSVPKIINQDKLRSVFSKYGEISDVFVRHSVNPLGYAIIKFKNKQDVDRLLKEVDAVHVDGHKMEVKLGVKSNQSPENGDGAHGKTVSFAEPVSYIPPTHSRNLSMMDANFQVKDSKFMCSAQSEMNGQQIQTVEIICTHVDSSVAFHGCSAFRYSALQNISLKLNSICRNLDRLTRKPLMKRVYGALYEDLCWYRCIVHRVVIPEKPGKCIVEYIDYGNIAEVYYTNMVDLPEPFNQYCPLAMKCVFVNLTCNPNCLSNVSYLHHLINKRMSLSATLCAYSDWGVPEYKVYKCSSDGIDVIDELVRNGHAMYRAQQTSKSSTPLHNPDNPGCSNFLINHKPKKTSTNKAHPKKVATKELCNGVEKTEGKSVGNESMNSVVNDAVKSPKICSPDISGHSEDFVPKRIIKRGDISDVAAPVPVLGGSKTVSHLLKIDCVLGSLKLVNNIRNLVSFPADDSIIDKAVDLSLSEVTDTVSQDQKNLLESSHKKYIEAFNNIKECTDQKLLSDLKEKRDQEKNELLNVLKQFLGSFDCSLLSKRKKIQNLITDLESNSTAWMNVHTSSLPDTIEELVTEYNKERELRWSIIRKARENTNEKHKKFMEFLGDFMKEFSLNMLDDTGNSSCHLENSGGKRGSYTLKFDESLSDLGNALEEETKTCSVAKGESYVPVSKFILEKLDIPKEKIDCECELYMKYKSLYDDLNAASDISSLLKELSAVQNNIQALTLNCSDDKEKFQNGLAELHRDLLLEDMLLEKLAKESTIHVPELILEHLELHLSEYKNNWCLLKNSWHKSYFPVLQNCSRLEPSYISKFGEEHIVIKELNIGSESERNALIKKAIVWNEIKSKFLVKIKALFNKDEIGVCAMFPQTWETLCKDPLPFHVNSRMAVNVLQHVLKGLYDIHERGMAHGAVHPLAVLYKDGKVLLDFNSDRKFDEDNFCVQGINFKDPSGDNMYKASDMFGFGCLVLLLLFSNLQFTLENGVPDIRSFQSIIESVLPDNGFTDLCNLLNPNHNLRPTSKDLYKKGFLKDVRITAK